MLTQSQLAQVNASVQAVVDASKRLVETVEGLVKPVEKWAAEKAAHAKGKVIQYLHSDGEWTDVASPSWFACDTYRIKPWSLPDPPQGREWHRNDGWREEWLQDGWRPLLKGEKAQVGDQYCDQFSELSWLSQMVDDSRPAESYVHFHQRTQRPLPPLPDPERERFEKWYDTTWLPSRDIKEASFIAWQAAQRS